MALHLPDSEVALMGFSSARGWKCPGILRASNAHFFLILAQQDIGSWNLAGNFPFWAHSSMSPPRQPWGERNQKCPRGKGDDPTDLSTPFPQTPLNRAVMNITMHLCLDTGSCKSCLWVSGGSEMLGVWGNWKVQDPSGGEWGG